jgi:hypothetical protein
MWGIIFFLAAVFFIVRFVNMLLVWMMAAGRPWLRIVGILIGALVVLDCAWTLIESFFDKNLNGIELAFTVLVYGYAVYKIGMTTLFGGIMTSKSVSGA